MNNMTTLFSGIDRKETITGYVDAFKEMLEIKEKLQIVDDEYVSPWVNPFANLMESTFGYDLMAWVDWWVYDSKFGTNHIKFKVKSKSYYADAVSFSEFYDLVNAHEMVM